MPFLRADARSYVLPSLRDSKMCNFKERNRVDGVQPDSLACASGLYYVL